MKSEDLTNKVIIQILVTRDWLCGEGKHSLSATSGQGRQYF